MLLNSVATTRPGTGLVLAEAVDFDGANDYLSRASDLTGNADGKTFTFSAWVWVRDAGANKRIYGAGNDSESNSSYFEMNSSVQFRMQLRNSGGTVILNAELSLQPGWNNTWVNILVSLNLANTAQRYVFVNDVDFTSSVTWTTYSNDDIDWTQASHRIGRADSGDLWNGRLAHVFLDYTYRDLSNSTNRRLFITSDRKPVNKSILTALNPILYLPMDDPSTAHVNAGTGGNFTLNGTIARSGRGPNQFNVPYSDLNGSTQYLSRTAAPTGVVDSSAFTVHFCINQDAPKEIISISVGEVSRFTVSTQPGDLLEFRARNSSATEILYAVLSGGSIKNLRNYVVSISVDLSDTAKRHVYINGQAITVTWGKYTNGTIDFNATTSRWYIAANTAGTAAYNGRLGNVFFHTSYIDLSVPANLAKFVSGTGIDAKPVDMGANGELPLGVQPLIYLPMYGNDAGRDYSGRGNHFTVNSGPFVGSRGPNEYWGNIADFSSNDSWLYRNALSGVSDSKTFSMSFFMYEDNDTINENILVFKGVQNGSLFTNTSQVLTLALYNAAGTNVLTATMGAQGGSVMRHFLISVDLADTNKRYVFVNGVQISPTWTTYVNDTANFSSSDVIFCSNSTTVKNAGHDGKLSEFYFTTEYIDFSQESNRLKFRDAFGNPVDLNPQIQAGTLPNPAIYMRFDPADQGKNSGIGGNFTKTGTISDGGQL